MKKISLISLLFLGICCCSSPRELATVIKVDINKYAGRWYEIARLPNSFEKGLECITAVYKVRDDGDIDVINKGHQADNREIVEEANGKAWVPDPNFPGRLKVSFFWPFAGDYYIIELDDNYQYVLVGDPSRDYLWILSKAKILDDNVYNKLIKTAKQRGFDTEKMIIVKHDCK
ncbi:MAG: lipocalin family protein [Candidatus Kapabacteria bacterium]|jgi:apolipoprotein D and lipocalin family protein|nr:lipocalin family protein [Candidatus Kapabacteria bacterium]